MLPLARRSCLNASATKHLVPAKREAILCAQEGNLMSGVALATVTEVAKSIGVVIIITK